MLMKPFGFTNIYETFWLHKILLKKFKDDYIKTKSGIRKADGKC